MSITCRFLRYRGHYCDVFNEEGHYLYVEAEHFGWPHLMACKEFTPVDDGFIVSGYSGTDAEYLLSLTPAGNEMAEKIIESEERHTLEKMAHEYGYTPEYAVEVYREMLADGETPEEAFQYIACCMMEKDL